MYFYMSFYYIESYKNEGSCDFLNNNKYQTQSCIVRMLSNLSKLPYYKDIQNIELFLCRNIPTSKYNAN